MKDEINAKLLLHDCLQFFLVGTHITILQENGTKLTLAFLVYGSILTFRGYIREVQSLNDATITLDTELAVSLVTLIDHRFQNGLELFDGGEMVLQSLLDGIGCPLLLTLSYNAADDFLRTDSFMMVVDLVAIRGNSAGDDVQVVVVSIVMGINENRLTILAIAHFFEILMGNV